MLKPLPQNESVEENQRSHANTITATGLPSWWKFAHCQGDCREVLNAEFDGTVLSLRSSGGHVFS